MVMSLVFLCFALVILQLRKDGDSLVSRTSFFFYLLVIYNLEGTLHYNLQKVHISFHLFALQRNNACLKVVFFSLWFVLFITIYH
ncbi:hypothetical protein BD770DRAFT_387842 [Pilaira anomala]|nr:hypothetical protein BD770DRAFT_387842 [Pilaira anomala]